jgi:hypothetical protein
MSTASPGPITDWTEEDFDSQANIHNRIVTLLWLFAGSCYVICTGRILSLASLALFIPGVFVADLLALVGWTVCVRLLLVKSAFHRSRRWYSGRIAGIVGTAWLCVMLAGPVCLAVLYVRLVRAIVSHF